MLVMMFVVAEVGGGRGSVPGDATQEHHTADREQGKLWPNWNIFCYLLQN